MSGVSSGSRSDRLEIASDRLPVQRNLLRFLLLLFSVCLITAHSLTGMTIEEPDGRETEVRQYAVIHRNGLNTTLTLTTEYYGYAGPWACFVSVPGDAENLNVIENGQSLLNLFGDFLYRTDPKYRTEDRTCVSFQEAALPQSSASYRPAASTALSGIEVSYEIFDPADQEGFMEWYRKLELELADDALEGLLKYPAAGWKVVALKFDPGGRSVPSGRFVIPVTLIYRSETFAYAPIIMESGSPSGGRLTLFALGKSSVRSVETVVTSSPRISGFPKYSGFEQHIDNELRWSTGGTRLAMLWSGPIERDPYRDELPGWNSIMGGQPGGLEEEISERHLTRLESFVGGQDEWRPIILAEDTDPVVRETCIRPKRGLTGFESNLIATPMFYFRKAGGGSFAIDTDIQLSFNQHPRRIFFTLGSWISLNMTDISNLTMLGVDLLLSIGRFGYVGTSWCGEYRNSASMDPVLYWGIKAAFRPWFLRFEISQEFFWSVGLLQASYYWNRNGGEDMWAVGLVSLSVGLSI